MVAFYGTTAELGVSIPRPRLERHVEAIELQVERVALLFDPLDPFPLPSRDIAKPVEAFIVEWARELRDGALHIVVLVPRSEAANIDAADLERAISSYFAKSAESLSRDLRALLRMGRFSLLIGIGVLTACTIGANAVTQHFHTPIAGIVS